MQMCYTSPTFNKNPMGVFLKITFSNYIIKIRFEKRLNRKLLKKQLKLLNYLVSSATLMLAPSGTINPRWALRRQLVGPVWAHTWVAGLMMENLTWNKINGFILMT